MNLNQHIDETLIKWRIEASRGKHAKFSEWVFFDTNCLSDLIKLANKGYADRVLHFVEGFDIIVPSTVLQELRYKPDLASQIPTVFASANLYLLSHPTRFWHCDIWNFINVSGFVRNVLDVYQIP